MCMSSSPTASPQQNRPVQYMHNPYLDGNTIAGAGMTMGRNSLRIDLGAPTRAGVNPSPGPAPRPGTGTPTQRTAPVTPTAGLAGLTPGIVVPTIGGSLAGALPRPTVGTAGLPARTR